MIALNAILFISNNLQSQQHVKQRAFYIFLGLCTLFYYCLCLKFL